MEYYADANLRSFQQHQLPSWWNRYWILRRIADGLYRAHGENIIHCDLHSGNILCNDWSVGFDNPVISDFGLSKNIINQSSTPSNGSYGIISYMAPELLRGQAHTKASDVYALGMIMWELSSGEPPFNNRSHTVNLMLDICNGVRPSIIKGTPGCWVQLMKQCWDNDPAKRSSAEQIYDTVCDWKFSKQFALFSDGEARPRGQQPTMHPRSVYTSRFIPPLSALETYAKTRNLELNDIDDDEWDTMVSDITSRLLYGGTYIASFANITCTSVV
jgi:serine/threonine protein kinase